MKECRKCHEPCYNYTDHPVPRELMHDPCLGNIPLALGACCGHEWAFGKKPPTHKHAYVMGLTKDAGTFIPAFLERMATRLDAIPHEVHVRRDPNLWHIGDATFAIIERGFSKCPTV